MEICSELLLTFISILVILMLVLLYQNTKGNMIAKNLEVNR
jgi:hypothetical protein